MITKLATVILDRAFTKNLRIAIVRTNYYNDMLDNLESYATKTLKESGVKEENIESFTVPGSWEVPLLTQRIAESKKFDGIIAFGVLVKGDTHHFDMIVNEVGRALMQTAMDYSIPVALEILAVYKMEDAKVRAGKDSYNKGIEAANAVLQTIQTLRSVKA